MKNFDNFIDILNEDKVKTIVDVAEHSLSEINGSNDKCFAISYNVALGLLKEYHEWLNKG